MHGGISGGRGCARIARSFGRIQRDARTGFAQHGRCEACTRRNFLGNVRHGPLSIVVKSDKIVDLRPAPAPAAGVRLQLPARRCCEHGVPMQRLRDGSELRSVHKCNHRILCSTRWYGISSSARRAAACFAA